MKNYLISYDHDHFLKADLHLHTYHSDGRFSPKKLLQMSVENDLEVVSITDHDTVQGLPEAAEAAEDYACHFLPGVELEAFVNFSDGKYYSVHLLGYGIDWKNETLRDYLVGIRQARIARAEKILHRLRSNFSIDLPYSAVSGESSGESVGRVHIASALKKYDHVKTIEEAFDKYIGEERAAYAAKPRHSPEKIINLLKQAGGHTVWAHPYYTQNDDVLPLMVEKGLDGLECYHHEFDSETTRHYLKLANQYELTVTGGSDFHGTLEEDFEPGDWWYPTPEVPFSSQNHSKT